MVVAAVGFWGRLDRVCVRVWISKVRAVGQAPGALAQW